MMVRTGERDVRVAIQHVFVLAERLPNGQRSDTVRRLVADVACAADEKAGVEPAVTRLVQSLRGLEECQVSGLRREFQRNSPAIGRVLETLQEDLLPALRRAGFHV